MGKRINTAKWIETRQRWQINVQKDGERKTFTSSKKGRNGMRECHRKADQWLDGNLINQNIKVKDFFPVFLEEKIKLGQIGTSRIQNYKSIFNVWVNPIIGKKKVSALTEQHCQDVLNEQNNPSIVKRRRVGKGRIRETRTFLKELLKYARKQQITTLYPEYLEIPQNAYIIGKDIIQPKDLKILFSSNKTFYHDKEYIDFFIYAYRFMALTGLRRGELIALEKNRDLNGHVLTINYSINEYMELTEGKTENAKRVMVLPNLAIEILEQQKNMLKEKNINSKYIFPSEDGSFIRPATLTYHFNNYVKYNKFEGRITLHSLRHTFSSINKNIDDTIKKSIFGHSENTDKEIYNHVVDGELDIASNTINNNFTTLLNS